MRMIVSDYDDTFFHHNNENNHEELLRNMTYVHEFMKKGLFVFATGRSYKDFMDASIKENLKFNYLIVNYGATILKDDKVIFNKCIKNEVKDLLLKDLDLESAVEVYGCFEKESMIPFLTRNLTKIYIRYNSVTKAQEIFDLIIKKYSDVLNVYMVDEKNAMEIVDRKVNKAFATKYIAEIEKIDNSDIYTIGDGYSDIKMIKEFNGSCVTNAVDALKKHSKVKYNYVFELIPDIMNKRD